MASDNNGNKKHKCSCGRAFRHAISLKRHQKVAGCDPAEEAAPEVAEVAVEASQDEVLKAEITAQQVAAWQRQRGFVAPVAPKKPLIDWEAVQDLGEQFVDFLHESKTNAASALSNLLHVGARLSLFGMVVGLVGWALLSGNLLASPAAAQNIQHPELAAQTVVENFLQTTELKQYERARTFLASSTRPSVSAAQLEAMFAGLNLSQTPQSWDAELDNDGRSAKVTVHRGSSNEVYTLVQDTNGWGLCSVSISRS